MSDTTLVTTRDESLRASLLIAYGLYLAALFTGGLTALAGVILVYARRQEARGTVWQSHCRNLLWVFWLGVVGMILLAAAMAEGAGNLMISLSHTGDVSPTLMAGLITLVSLCLLGGVILAVFYLYRTLRGFIHAIDGRQY